MAIGNVNQIIYLPGQIIYRYTSIKQIIAATKELEAGVMAIFQSSPAMGPVLQKYRLLEAAASSLYQGRAFYLREMSTHNMAIPIPGTGQGPLMAPKDRVSLTIQATGQAASPKASKTKGGA